MELQQAIHIVAQKTSAAHLVLPFALGAALPARSNGEVAVLRTGTQAALASTIATLIFNPHLLRAPPHISRYDRVLMPLAAVARNALPAGAAGAAGAGLRKLVE